MKVWRREIITAKGNFFKNHAQKAFDGNFLECVVVFLKKVFTESLICGIM